MLRVSNHLSRTDKESRVLNPDTNQHSVKTQLIWAPIERIKQCMPKDQALQKLVVPQNMSQLLPAQPILRNLTITKVGRQIKINKMRLDPWLPNNIHTWTVIKLSNMRLKIQQWVVSLQLIAQIISKVSLTLSLKLMISSTMIRCRAGGRIHLFSRRASKLYKCRQSLKHLFLRARMFINHLSLKVLKR